MCQIVLLVERLNHSKGPQKVQMAIGNHRFQQYEAGSDLTTLLKQAYPHFFELERMNNTQADIFSC